MEKLQTAWPTSSKSSSIRERLELFVEICDGVQHAHQKGIIHRDLKPSNLLVAIRDGRPAPKIIDFGVAKAISQRLTEKTVATELGQLIGTPEYMSPEQAEMTNLDIDTRSDVYSLGVVLYELLVGAHPLDSDALRAGGFDELRRRIREDDSPMPSERLGSLGGRAEEAAARRRCELSALKREIAGDLDWVAMKALEKDRSRRYGSPAELAADLRRYFGDEPVVARPPGGMYRARKFVRRHRVGVAVSAAAAVVLVAFSATTAVQSRRVRTQRDRAEREAAKSVAALDFFQKTLASADPNQGLGREVTVIDALEKAAESVAESFPERPEIRGAVESTLGHTYLQLGRLDDAERWLEAALETLEAAPEAEPKDVATTRFELARTRNLKGKYDEAEPLALSAMEEQRAVLGPRHPDVAHSLSLLAEIARWRGDLEKAETLFREALAIRREHFSSAHPDLVAG